MRLTLDIILKVLKVTNVCVHVKNDSKHGILFYKVLIRFWRHEITNTFLMNINKDIVDV